MLLELPPPSATDRSDAPMTAVSVVSMPVLDASRRVHTTAPAGSNVEQIVAHALPGIGLTAPVEVYIDGVRILRPVWRRVRPKAGTTVVVRLIPQGGGAGGTRGILQILVAIAAIAAQIILGPILGPLGTFLVTTAILIGGNLLINALVPLPKQDQGQTKPNYTIGGFRNQLTPDQPVPKILGRHRIAPPYVVPPFTTTEGDDRYVTAAFLLGYGPLTISDIRLGDTPLSKFKDVQYEVREGIATDAALSLTPTQVIEEQLSVELSKADADLHGPPTRYTASNATEASIDLLFPSGLWARTRSGRPVSATVQVRVRMRKVGATSWTTVGTLTYTMYKQQGFFRTFRWDLPDRGRYEIELSRLTADTDDIVDAQAVTTVQWVALRSFRPEYPIQWDMPLALIAVKVKATKQLNGTLDTLNCIVESRIPDWDTDTGTWIERGTNNPASHYRYALQGPENLYPFDDDEIDLDALAEWHEFCTAKGLTYNRIHDDENTLLDVLEMIAAAGRAVPEYTGEKWTVIIDRPREDVIAHISTRNSWNFSGERIYTRFPDAFRVSFIDETDDYAKSERTVRRPGYSGSLDVVPTISMPGVTDPEQVYREALRRHYEAVLRPDGWVVEQDVEGNVVGRGDLVRLNHDVLSASHVSGRVVAVDEGSQTVTLDETVTMDGGGSYAIRFRTLDGTTPFLSLQRGVTADAGEQTEIVLSGSGDLPNVGDLFQFGEASAETFECIVKAIDYNDNLTCRLTLVPHAPTLEELADDAEVPEWEGGSAGGGGDPVVVPPSATVPAAPDITITSGREVGTVGDVLITLAPGLGNTVSLASYAVEHRLDGAGVWTGPVTVTAAEASLLLSGTYSTGDDIEVRARALGINGVYSAYSTTAEHTVGENDPAYNASDENTRTFLIIEDAEAADDIADTVMVCVVHGYDEVGDTQDSMLFERVDAEPTHEGKFYNAASDSWWSLKNIIRNKEMFDGDAQDAADASAGKILQLFGDTVTLAVPSQYSTIQDALDAAAGWQFFDEAIAYVDVSGHLTVTADYIALVQNLNSPGIRVRGAHDALTKTIASTGHSVATVAASAARYRPGSGYTPGTHTGLGVVGGVYSVQATLDVVVGSDGRVSSASLNNPGSYTATPSWPIAVTGIPGGGSGASFSINWVGTSILALADVDDVSVGDVINVDEPTYRGRQWRWGMGAQDGSRCGTLTVIGTAMTLAGQVNDLLAVGDLIFVNGESRQITARASATSFTIDSAFTTTVPDADEPDPDAESVVGAVYWYFVKGASGTISTTGRSTSVVGTGTTFTNYAPGDILFAFGIGVLITEITDDTHLTVEVAQEYTTAPFGVHALALGWCGSFKITGVDSGAKTVTYTNVAQVGQLTLHGKQIDGGTVTILRDVVTNSQSGGHGIVANGVGLGAIERIALAGASASSGTGIGTAISTAGENKAASVVVGDNVGLTDFGISIFCHFGSVNASGVCIGNNRGAYAAMNYQGEVWLGSARLSTSGSNGIFAGPGSTTYLSYAVVVGAVIGLYKLGGITYGDGAQYIFPRVSGVQTIASAGGHDTEAWVWGALIGLNYGGIGTSARFAGARLIACTTGAAIGFGVGAEGNYSWATGCTRGFSVNGDTYLVGACATGNNEEGVLAQLGARVFARRAVARRNGTYGIRATNRAKIDAQTSYARYNTTYDYRQEGLESSIDKTDAISSFSTTSGPVGTVSGWLQVEEQTSVASATTCDIGATLRGRVKITGTTTITSLGTTPNRLVFLEFAGILTLTYNATTLKLPTSASIVTAAGDTAVAESDASGNWRVSFYYRASGGVLDPDLVALAGLSTTGLIVRTGSGTAATRTLTGPAAGISVSNGSGVSGNPTLALANDLAAVEGLASTGIAVRTTTDTWAQRQVTQPAAGITVTNPAGVAGDITLALANDLSALEGLGSTGLAARTGTDAWAQRTITGTTNEVDVSNGSGASGNPTLSIPTLITIKAQRGLLLSETATLIGSMTTAPKHSRSFLIDDTIRDLKDAGLWSTKICILWVLAAHDSQAALLDWITPGSHTLIPTNAPTFTADEGYIGDAATSWLDSGVTLASISGLGYAQNDAGKFVWSLTDSDNSGRDIGTSTSFNSAITGRLTNLLASRANDGTTNSTGAAADSLGLYGWTRSSSTTYDKFRGGSIIASPVVTSTGVPGGNISVLRASTGFSPRKIAIAGVTKGLSSGNISDLHTILDAYMSAL